MDASDRTDDILTPHDFARIYKIPRGTQAAMRSRGQVPFFRLGGGRIIRYRRSEIEQWISQRAAGGGR